MRIVVWCAARGIPLYGPSGASAHLRGVAKALIGRGHDVQVAVPLASDGRGRWDADPPLPAIHLDGVRWPSGLRTFGARLDGHRLAWRGIHGVDLVWERHEPLSAAGARWAWIRGVPRVVELDAPLSIERRWPRDPRPAELAREVALLRRADRVVAVSGWLARWAVDVGCRPERVLHVPNGVEPQDPGDRARIRERYGLRGPTVGFLGSMSPWQGADRIPAILDGLGSEWTALVVGDGVSPPRPHPRLVATGRVDPREVPDLVSAFDVGLAPYPGSAPPWFCPLKVLAYRAQGVPVVASDLGDCAALVGDQGEVVPPDGVDGWIDAIRRAVDRPRLQWTRTWDDVVGDALAGVSPDRGSADRRTAR